MSDNIYTRLAQAVKQYGLRGVLVGLEHVCADRARLAKNDETEAERWLRCAGILDDAGEHVRMVNGEVRDL